MNRPVADYSLTSNILRYSDMECLDPRDRVYGLLGISAPGSLLTVDYEKTLTEIYIDVMTPEVEWSMEIIRCSFLQYRSGTRGHAVYACYAVAYAMRIPILKGLWEFFGTLFTVCIPDEILPGDEAPIPRVPLHVEKFHDRDSERLWFNLDGNIHYQDVSIPMVDLDVEEKQDVLR